MGSSAAGACAAYSPAMRIRFCGVRGSMPSTGPDFVGVGGNTSCVVLAHDGGPPCLAIDAGTGLRNLTELVDGVPYRGSIVLTHLHLDHVMGLPFFRAGDRNDARVRLLLPEQGVDPVELLSGMLGPPFFPITPIQLRGVWSFESYDEGIATVERFTVLAREIPHKGGRTMGLRISDGSSSIAYLSDHAPQNLGPGEDGLGELHEAALELADGVDVLIHGAQYTREELPQRFDFGHAAADYGVSLAQRCGAGRLVLFHHDPWRTDDQVAAMAAELSSRSSVPVEIGTESLVIDTSPTV
jgi:phosphoribosyl 1,2-cyclic phosphodiesterase